MREPPRDAAQAEAHLRAVSAVGRAVEAILALSTAQLPRVEEMAAEGSAYLDRVDRLVTKLAGPPVARALDVETSLTVVVGPERPWCGALTARVLAEVPLHGELGLVGAQLIASRPDGWSPRVRFARPGAADPAELPTVTHDVAAAILAAAGDRQVELLYPVGPRGRVERAVLLPGARAPAEALPETWSPVEEVLAAAVTEAAIGRVEVALAETLRAEVEARVARSRAASQACRNRSEELTDLLRVLRQEEVTREVCELASASLR